MIHCGECHYCELIKPDEKDMDRGYVCRRYPPQVTSVFDVEDGVVTSGARFPWVHPKLDWCGEAEQMATATGIHFLTNRPRRNA